MQCDLKNMAIWITGILGGFLILMIACSYWQTQRPLMVVDMNRAIQKPSMILARSKLTVEEQANIMKQFSKLLPEVIKDYGASHQVSVIASQVLVNQNNMDITDSIVELTIARMKHDS